MTSNHAYSFRVDLASSKMKKVWMPSTDETLEKLKQLYSFIGRYRAICEAHSVDFYLHDNWSNCLPQSWRDEIVNMDECWYANPPDASSGGGSVNEGVCRCEVVCMCSCRDIYI